MARLKIAYVGGGSTRGAGHDGELHRAGRELRRLGDRADRPRRGAARADPRPRAADGGGARASTSTVTATTDRRAGLDGCDAVLTSYRPGGFEARVLDERIPLAHGVIGQETQGPGGFFMALRSIHVMQGILDGPRGRRLPGRADLQLHEPGQHRRAGGRPTTRDVPFVSLCEGPIVFPEEIAEAAGLDPARLDVASVGLNHGSWSVRAHATTAQDLLPLVAGRLRAPRGRPGAAAADAPDAAARRRRWTRCRASTSSTTTSRTRSSAS